MSDILSPAVVATLSAAIASDVPVVHAVTDDAVVAAPGFLDAAEAVMRALGRRGAVHLRAPAMEARALYALALRLAAAQATTGCWLVVNERIDVALAAGARGAQLTRRSVLVADARLVAPSLRFGVSVHTAAGAAAAAAHGASWVVAGHVHATASHPGEPGRGDGLVVAAALGGAPVIAIGGVKPAHVRALRAAGAHGVATIRGIWGSWGDDADADAAPSESAAERAERAAAEYLSAHDESDGRAGPARDDARDGER